MERKERRDRGGFTREELLAVVAVFLLLLAVLIPRILRDGNRAHLTATISDGKQIYLALFAMEEPWMTNAPHISWPTSKDINKGCYRSSSEFCSWLVESNCLDVTYGFFVPHGSGIPIAKNRAEFLDGTLHNAWCITLDVNVGMKSGAPVLFTQNVKFKSRGPDATLDQMVGLEPNARPFGSRAAVLLQRGGAGFWLSGDSLSLTNFNAPGATNGFLWPLASGQDVSD